LDAGTEQRPIQERAPPRDRQQRQREDLGADVLLADALADDGHPLAYRPFTYQEYSDEFWNMGLQSASSLDRFRPGGWIDQ